MMRLWVQMRDVNSCDPGGGGIGWLAAEQGKNYKIKSLAAPPPPPPHLTLLVRRKSNKKSRDASTCLGATQASVRLASVQGFLRLVS